MWFDITSLCTRTQSKFGEIQTYSFSNLVSFVKNADVTFKSVMEQLARTTFPIGWDDADSKTVIKQVSVGTFNQVTK